MDKLCRQCRTRQPIENFGTEGKHRKSRCRPCENKRMRAYRLANLADRRAKDREAYRRNRKRDRASFVARQYGLTIEQAEAVAEVEACDICETPLNDTRRAVDHCHDTGRNRGVLCHGCNLAIGHLRDDPVRAEAVARYLRAGGSGRFH